ncbi:MAG: hypothetical protein NUV47_00935 [Patescibacteria group bacterium]|nr:hypothetical protein [Patescibacteria group bacterium]
MEKNLKSKPRYEFFDLPKDIQTDEEIKKTIYYKAFKLALNESRTRSKIEVKTKIPFWFFSPLNTASPAQPIVSIALSSSATILENTLPIRTTGLVKYVGVSFLTPNGANDIAFNITLDGRILSTLSKIQLYESFNSGNLIPIEFSLPNKAKLTITGYNNSSITAHDVKMCVLGYYYYVKGD